MCIGEYNYTHYTYMYVRYFEFFFWGGRGMCGCKYLTFKIFIEASEFETREKVAASER